MIAEEFLRDLFESDRDATDYYRRHPMYEHDALVGAKPWWPALSEVWQRQGQRSETDNNEHWPAAWELLRTLHSDYLRTRARH